jgi:hypothetical protein
MEYILKKGEVMSLEAAVTPVIRVKEGVVWLTRTEDTCDYVLQPCDSFVRNGAGSLVLESLSDCTFDIQCPDTAPCQLTIQLTLTGPQKIGI